MIVCIFNYCLILKHLVTGFHTVPRFINLKQIKVKWHVGSVNWSRVDKNSGLCNSMQKRMMFAGFTAAKKTIIQNWFTPHMCRKTYWIRSLLQIVHECTTARVGGARPSTIDAWQCFLVDIRDCRSDFCVLVVLPSLPPFWLDLEMLSICLLFCFCVLDAMLCCVWKKKNVDKKRVDTRMIYYANAHRKCVWIDE